MSNEKREEQMMALARSAELNSRTIDLSKKQVFMSAYIQGWQDADSHPKWIPVEEELPKKDGKYLFYDEALGHEVSIYYDGVTLVPSITHWMPLPQAPRKEE